MPALTYVVHRVPRAWVEVGGRLLGRLPAAAGVDLVIVGLQTMGLIVRRGHP